MRYTKRLLMTAVFCTVALLGAIVFAQEKSGSSSDDEAGAVGGSRTVNTAEVTYASTYNKGYSVNLQALGPEGSTATETHAGLIDKELAQGRKHNYVYTYKPGVKDKNGHISSYSLTVRPAKWQKGAASFYTDQTGVIRYTRENRAPTAKDKPLGE